MDSIHFLDHPELSVENITKMKVADLKVELKTRGLSTSGIKTELIERLQASVLGSNKDCDISEPSDDINEDEVLGDDTLFSDDGKGEMIIEDDILDGKDSLEMIPSSAEHHRVVLKTNVLKLTEKSNLMKNTATNAVTSLTAITTNKNSETNCVDRLANVITQKSVVNNKNPPLTTLKATATGEFGKVLSETENKPINDNKVALSEDEKKELRAKRFNVKLESGKLATRAERFGVVDKSAKSTTNKTTVLGQKMVVDVEVLKKRSARFGQSVSTVIKEVEIKDNILKRKERFGTVIPSAVGVKVNANEQEKKKLRAQRFGMP